MAGVVTTVIATGVTLGAFAWVTGARLLTAIPYLTPPASPLCVAFVALVGSMGLAFSGRTPSHRVSGRSAPTNRGTRQRSIMTDWTVQSV